LTFHQKKKAAPDQDAVPGEIMFEKPMFVRAFAASLLVLSAGVASAQEYPNKVIRIVTPGGGGTDFVARILAQGLTTAFKQQVIVDNRPTALTGGIVSQAAPDGYTLLLNGSSFWLAPLLQSKPTYDALRDFTPISLLTTSPSLLVVHPSLPVKSVKELIAFAKARPGQLDYGSNILGSPSHLAGELFKSMAGVNIMRIGYKGNGPALTATIAGEVQLTIVAAGAAAPHTASGRLRALAVASEKPTALAPGLPTVAETLPGYEAVSRYGLLGPAKLPRPVVERLNQEVVRFVQTPETRDRFFKSGVDAVGSTAAQLGAIIANDLKLWGRLIKEVGIRAD